MPLNPADFPPTPHSVTWKPKKDANRGGPANDGPADSVTLGGEIAVYVEPRPAIWAEKAYGVITERQTYLIVGKVADLEHVVKGDVLTYGDIDLVAEMKPQIYGPYLGFSSAELVATNQTTGGR